MKNILLTSTLLITLGSSVTFNLAISFGGDSSFENNVAYLVGSQANTGAFSTGNTYDLSTSFDLADSFGDFSVLTSSFTSNNDLGDHYLQLANTNIDTEVGGLTGIGEGDKLGIIWHDGTTVFGYTGDATPDTDFDAFVSDGVGWVVQPQGTNAANIFDMYQTFNVGGSGVFGRIDPANVVTLGTIVPEPSSSALLVLGGVSLLSRRKRS